MLLNREFKRQHLPWVVLAVALGLGLGGWYFAASVGRPDWPGGSSTVGLTLGIVGGGIIVFEFLLWPRKKARRHRWGRVKHWMAAHIWLGLLCLPLLILHSGFRLGGALAATLTVLLMIVVFSGVYGLVLQQYLPRQMLEEVPSETIYSQIDHIDRLTRIEAARLVEATCGPAEGESLTDGEEEVDDDPLAGAGGTARRSWSSAPCGRPAASRGRSSRPAPRPPRCPSPSRSVTSSRTSGPLPSRRCRLRLAAGLRGRAEGMFRDLRTRDRPQGPPDRRGPGRRLRPAPAARPPGPAPRRLHGWLLVHLPLSIALVVLMVIHIYVAMKYW